jgi:hypothetical protein
VHWLRHAIAEAGRLAQEEPEEDVDGTAAMALADALAHFAELDGWELVTLKDVADHATLMNQERFKTQCTCGAFA